ncbi:helix-turn-helix transcriptional regulator [Ferrimonas sediminicola]|uniref:Helix-turn-helix transcriptional regulator n=1 Tax=Ferrimonas sediminicola TaxID=2569538 RepID=A0A4U1BG88_9GAMM|nr:AraC family transcriptional regulator [Ferrimonas sediminicola]TKB49973.1 helix-turn-helix transcriptional regulator [Ferrimonas sediminicola]
MLTTDVPKVVIAHFAQLPSERIRSQLADAVSVDTTPFDQLDHGDHPCLIEFDTQSPAEVSRARELRQQQPRRQMIWLMPRLTIPLLRLALSLRIAQVFTLPLSPSEAIELKLLLNSDFYAPGHSQRPTHQKLRCVLDSIEQRFEQPLSLQQLAQEAGISDSRLCHLFRQQLGLKFSLYLVCRRLEAAPEALQDEGLNIASVAYKLGFSTPSHFCRAFKAHYGITPSEFKQDASKGKHSHAFHRYLQCRHPDAHLQEV